MSESKTPKPWYKKWWGILLVIMFFPLLVPYLVWTKTNWSKYSKLIITALCVSIIVFGFVNANQKQEEAQNLVAQAEVYISEGKIDKALEAINKSKQLNSVKEKNPAFSLEEKINKLNSDDFMRKTLNEMSDRDFELLKNGKLRTVFIDHPELNSLFLNKLAENADKRTEFKKEGRESRKEKIEKQFSAVDGSHRNLTKYIKDTMNDPESYEHVKTVYQDKGDYLIVSTTYKGKNLFGGSVKNTIKAKVSLDGDILEILEQRLW